MIFSSPSRLEIWLTSLVVLGLSVLVSARLTRGLLDPLRPKPHRLVPRAGETRIAFAPTAEALEKYRMFKLEKDIAWLTPDASVLVRVRGKEASFVEVVAGGEKGRAGYVEAALVDDGWH